MKPYKLLFLIPVILFSCQKDNEPNTNTIDSCFPNSGSFSISIKDSTYDMVIDENTQFTIFYNYYTPNGNDFILDAEHQHGGELYVEAILPSLFSIGTHEYYSSTLPFDLFNISLDTFSLYVSEATFDVSQSVLGEQGIIYEPIVATFDGIAHSYPLYNGQPPRDTVLVSGSFCLNRYMLP